MFDAGKHTEKMYKKPEFSIIMQNNREKKT